MRNRTTTLLATAIAALFMTVSTNADDKPSMHQGTPHDPAIHGAHHTPAGPLQHGDDRQPVRLTIGERNFVLHEMRNFLITVDGIVAALAADNRADIARHAKASGMGTTHDVPRAMMRKMPAEWRTLGMDTHQRFDALALEATGIGDKTEILKQLSGILSNCTGCHAAYRLVAEQPE